MSFFRDPIWQFIGVLLAALALAGSLVSFFRNRSRKILILASDTTPLINAKIQELEIQYKGEKLSNVDLTTFTIENVGKAPITSSDFDHAAWIVISETQKVIFISPSKSHLRLEVIEDGKRIGIKPFLLNAGEKAEFKVAVAGGWSDIGLDLRLVSTKVISRRDYAKLPNIRLKNAISVIALSYLPQLIWLILGAYVASFLASRFIK